MVRLIPEYQTRRDELYARMLHFIQFVDSCGLFYPLNSEDRKAVLEMIAEGEALKDAING